MTKNKNGLTFEPKYLDN